MGQGVNQFLGYLEITSITNFSLKNNEIPEDCKFTLGNFKFVQYPDCQQLILWLPDHGDNYDSITLYRLKPEKEVWKKKISDILSGSIKIILDTSEIEPGKYKIVIIKYADLKHEISFNKSADYFKPPEDMVTILNDELEKPIVYSDGSGNKIPDEDLIIRETLYNKTVEKLMRKVRYENFGRGGYAIFVEGSRSIKFEMEYGGGNCSLILFIPSIDNWEALTGFSIGEREEIIMFVAERVLGDQFVSSNVIYKISDSDIMYLKNQ